MRNTDRSATLKPQATELVAGILPRRGGALLNLDKALLWSAPLARGWNVFLKAVRSELPTERKLRELGICCVALLTGASYEYQHHAPDFLAHGGTAAQLDALQQHLKNEPHQRPASELFDAAEKTVIEYAAQMTLDVTVSEAVFNRLRSHFDTTEIVELTSAIATYNMVARFLVALEITPERQETNQP